MVLPSVHEGPLPEMPPPLETQSGNMVVTHILREWPFINRRKQEWPNPPLEEFDGRPQSPHTNL